MIKINKKDLKVIIPIIAVFLIVLAVTLIYPQYNDIWTLLFWIGLFYISFRTLSDSDDKIKSLKDIPTPVKITFILAIIVGLLEVHFSNSIMISTALMVLAIVFDIIFNRKKE